MKKTLMEKRLRIHIGEDERWYGKPLYEALLALARREGLSGASAVKSVAGFGAKGLPVIVEIVDSEAKIDSLLPKLKEMLDDALVTLEDVPAFRFH